jgi:hypothetical protein
MQDINEGICEIHPAEEIIQFMAGVGSWKCTHHSEQNHGGRLHALRLRFPILQEPP